jgi:hypothetical protein
MLSHLKKLVKQGFMAVAELEACQVPKDPAFPALTEGYMVSFMAFYEWGFGVPPHPSLCEASPHNSLGSLAYRGLHIPM